MQVEEFQRHELSFVDAGDIWVKGSENKDSGAAPEEDDHMW